MHTGDAPTTNVICMYTYTYTHRHTYMYIHVLYIYVYFYIYQNAYIYTLPNVYQCASKLAYMCVYIYTFK